MGRAAGAVRASTAAAHGCSKLGKKGSMAEWAGTVLGSMERDPKERWEHLPHKARRSQGCAWEGIEQGQLNLPDS